MAKDKFEKNKLRKLNDILYSTLERLDNESNTEDALREEIQRSTAIQKTSQTLLNSVKTNLDIIRTSEKSLISISELNDFLGIKE